MDASIPSDDRLRQLSALVGSTAGLHFPPPRWPDLRRGMTAVARDLGFGNDVNACVRSLLASGATARSPSLSGRQLDALANRLTVGETYFFRQRASFDVLADHILPRLIHERRARGERRLRIWSAACCTGEEAYSIAILLRRAIPDLADWNVTLLATDLSPDHLRTAERGLFGRWSFRDTPDWVREHYFKPHADGRFEIIPEVRRMVRFAQLNLAADTYPSPVNDTAAMDVIFCRNVLMYFEADRASHVVGQLGRALVKGGWLAVGPTELFRECPAPYVPAYFDGAVFYRKDRIGAGTTAVAEMGRAAAPQSPLMDIPDEPVSAVEAMTSVVPDAESLRLLARRHADRGELDDAIHCLDRSIAADKLNPASHYLRATVLMERGETDEAIQSLRRTLYLEPAFALAHFALGNVARSRGQSEDARRHFENALRLLRRYPADAAVAEADGACAGHFIDAIEAVLGKGVIA